MTHNTCWLWPDRTIGKQESRQLREEHNAVVHEVDRLKALNADLVSALTGTLSAMDAVATGATLTTPEQFAQNIRAQARTALAKAAG